MTKEEIVASFLIETQARSYRLAYSVLQNREEALDAVQAAACRTSSMTGVTSSGTPGP